MKAHQNHASVQSGVFGADMQIALENNGPVTFAQKLTGGLRLIGGRILLIFFCLFFADHLAGNNPHFKQHPHRNGQHGLGERVGRVNSMPTTKQPTIT